MNFPSIDIQGSILSADLLAKIRSEQATFQQGKDFKSDYTNARLKDEISMAWQEAKGQWTIYKSKLARLKAGETATTETRNFWISPLLTNLGYNLAYNRNSEEINGKSFPIGYRDSNLDNFPVYIGGYHESLDKRPENKQLRISPHAMVQEYLNYSEHLYGLVTNGRQLRLLRDASRITRLSYVEFNLEKMMEEDLYSDFVILYRVLHASRMPKKIDGGAESIIEKYHQEGLEAGSTIRSNLGKAVRNAIQNLANGFLNHPDNLDLRKAMADGQLHADDYYRLQLRIIYRLLFLFVIEERNLVYADNKTPEARRFAQLYATCFSLQKLRKLARKLIPPDAERHYELWMGLNTTFSLFERKEIGEKLGIMSLQGDLFGYDAIRTDRYDLHTCKLSNVVLLDIIKSLSYFENENGVLIAVNYGGLDVEEFGSVYEGLLELKLAISKIEGSDLYSCSFDTSNERGKSGSHYTPEELVQPLIKHSLEYLIEDRVKPNQQRKASKEATIQSLLNLKIADVACGSGHILLSAARRLALEIARIQTDEEQPNPLSIRKAMKDVVRNCIYGVDKNPLAVELCKIALWLEAYNPGEPLNFLDHHIKCGDAIVGLAHKEGLQNGISDEAFKTLPGDDKNIAKSYRDKNVRERKERAVKAAQLTTETQLVTDNSVKEAITEYTTFNQLPERSPEEIERKAQAYRKFIDSKGLSFLKAMADTQVAQFFIPKTDANKDYLMTDADYRLILSGYKGWQERKVAKATVLAHEQRFFHWFIEFPEVFSEGGFDCILGNPPYLGGTKISTNYGIHFSHYLLSCFSNVSGLADLVAYFIKRITSVLKPNSFFNIITTDSVSQGATRLSALEELLNKGSIIFAIRSMRWPGVAAVNVALIGYFKGNWKKDYFLSGQRVEFINSLLGETNEDNKINDLFENKNRVYTGSKVYGEGFVLSKEKADELLLDSKNEKVIKQYMTGDDIANEVCGAPSRFVINFQNWPLDRYAIQDWLGLSDETRNEINDRICSDKPILGAPYNYGGFCAKDFPHVLGIIENEVKPEREKVKGDINAQKYWWVYQRVRKEMYDAIASNKNVIVLAQTAKYILPIYTSNDKVYSVKVVVFTDESSTQFALLANTLYNEWCWKFGTTMGSSTLQYSTSQCFDAYPFPKINSSQLESLGEAYHEHRRQLMLGMQLGLTKTYNLFHSKAITAQAVNEKDKQAAALQKHLANTPNTISFNEAIEGILKLRQLHVQMDKAVLDAYGWGLDSAQPIELRHDFYKVDYLPENDRIRFTIHPEARKEVLKRLLELNHKIHEEEVKAGLWEKKKGGGKKKKGDELNEPEIGYNLFNQIGQ